MDVTNSGSVSGKEVVQLYLKAPAAKMAKPATELKAFDKTALLKPGQKQTISFTLNADALGSFETATTAWIAEAGKYEVRVGYSALAIKQRASFDLSKEIIVEKCNKVLAPQVAIKELVK
ncbi:MAG: fibronectin type III-like domain-contianing protein [Ferruginibacter sp.]